MVANNLHPELSIAHHHSPSPSMLEGQGFSQDDYFEFMQAWSKHVSYCIYFFHFLLELSSGNLLYITYCGPNRIGHECTTMHKQFTILQCLIHYWDVFLLSNKTCTDTCFFGCNLVQTLFTHKKKLYMCICIACIMFAWMWISSMFNVQCDTHVMI